MTKELILVLGGARSGKSSYAENLAKQQGPRVLYVATAEAWDDEMCARIAVHRAQRPVQWTTLEAPRRIAPAIRQVLSGQTDCVLIDCFTLLASNVLMALPEEASEAEATSALMEEVDALLALYAGGRATWVIVSNEVGLGIVPAFPLGRLYRDALGRANQRLAAAADRALFMVAGLPMTLK